MLLPKRRSEVDKQRIAYLTDALDGELDPGGQAAGSGVSDSGFDCESPDRVERTRATTLAEEFDQQ
jgi:hypothetical protein